MTFENILKTIAWKWVWNPYMTVMFLFIGIYLCIGMRGFQFRHFGFILRNTLFNIKDSRKESGKGLLTSFQAFSAACGGVVGMGNIAGVSSAIAIGGPGALFWMWFSALMGMGTKMAEVCLAQHYREVQPDGSAYGGATFYIQKGLGEERHFSLWKPLSVLFGLGMFVGFFVIQLGQYALVETFQATFHTSAGTAVIFNIAYTVLVFAVIIGGIKRIGRVAEIVVPFMTLFYILGGLGVVLAHASALPSVIGSIFKYAFTPHAAVGGFGGVAVIQALRMGVARGVYSNEAGWGSSPMVHATAQVDHPGQQGIWGAFDVFWDTVVGTITALMVLSTGLWTSGEGGAGLVAQAFASSYGSWGSYILFFAMFVFVFTSSTCPYTFIETLTVHVIKKAEARKRMISVLKYLFPLPAAGIAAYAILTGIKPAIVWISADIATGVPIYANAIALLMLSPVAFRIIKDYEEKYVNKGKMLK